MKKFTLKYDDTDDESGKLTAKEYNSLTQELVSLIKNTRGDDDKHFIYEGDENNLDLSKAIFYNKTIKNGFNLVLKNIELGNYKQPVLLTIDIEPDKATNDIPNIDKIFKIKSGQSFLCKFVIDQKLERTGVYQFWNNKPAFISQINNKKTIPYQEIGLLNAVHPPFFFDTREDNYYFLLPHKGFFNIHKFRDTVEGTHKMKRYANILNFANIIYPMEEYINQANTQRNYGELSNKPYNFSKDDTDINIVPYLNDNVQYYNPFKRTHSINESLRGKKEDKVNKVNINLLKAIKKPGIYKVKTKIIYNYHNPYNESIKKTIPPESKLKNLKTKVSVNLKSSNGNSNIFNFSNHQNNSNHINRFLLYPMLVHGYHNKNKRTHSTFYKIYAYLHPFMRYRSTWLKRTNIPQRLNFSCPTTQNSYKSLGLHKFTINEEFHGTSTLYKSKEYKFNSYYNTDIERMRDITSKTIDFFHGGREYTGGYLYLSREGYRLGPIDVLARFSGYDKNWLQRNFHPTIGNEQQFYESSWEVSNGREQWFWLIHTGYFRKSDYDERKNSSNSLSHFSWDNVYNYYKDRPNERCTIQLIKREIVIPFNNIGSLNIELSGYPISQYINYLNLNNNNYDHYNTKSYKHYTKTNELFLDYLGIYKNKSTNPSSSFEKDNYLFDYFNYRNFHSIIDHFGQTKITKTLEFMENNFIFTEQTIPLPLDNYNTEIKDILKDIESPLSTAVKIRKSNVTLLNLFSEINLKEGDEVSYTMKKDSLKYINGGTKGFIKDPQEKDDISYIVQEHPYYTINTSFYENIKIKTSYNHKNNDSFVKNDTKNFEKGDFSINNDTYLKYYPTFMYSQGIFIYSISLNNGTNKKTTKDYVNKIILRYYNEHDDLDKAGLKYIYPIKKTGTMSYQQTETLKTMNTLIKEVEFKKAKQFEHNFTIETFINIFTPNLSYLLDEQLRPQNENVSNMQTIIKNFYKLMYDINLEYIYKSKESNGYYGRYLNEKDIEWHKEFFLWYRKTFHKICKYDFITKTRSVRIKKEEKKDINSNLIDLKIIKSGSFIKDFTITLEDETIIDTDKAGVNLKIDENLNYKFLEYPLDINIEYEYNQDLLEKDPFYRPKEGRFPGQMPVNNTYKGEYDITNPIKENKNKENLIPYKRDFTRNIETNLELIKEYT